MTLLTGRSRSRPAGHPPCPTPVLDGAHMLQRSPVGPPHLATRVRCLPRTGRQTLPALRPYLGLIEAGTQSTAAPCRTRMGPASDPNPCRRTPGPGQPHPSLSRVLWLLPAMARSRCSDQTGLDDQDPRHGRRDAHHPSTLRGSAATAGEVGRANVRMDGRHGSKRLPYDVIGVLSSLLSLWTAATWTSATDPSPPHRDPPYGRPVARPGPTRPCGVHGCARRTRAHERAAAPSATPHRAAHPRP